MTDYIDGREHASFPRFADCTRSQNPNIPWDISEPLAAISAPLHRDVDWILLGTCKSCITLKRSLPDGIGGNARFGHW